MTFLTPFGSRFNDKIKQASMAAEEAAAKMRAMGPSELITHRALELETIDKVAQQLGQSLTKAIGGRIAVEIVYDYANQQYTVTVTNGIHPLTFLVNEETLGLHTGSVKLYHGWVTSAAARIKVLMERSPRPAVTAESWMETGKPRTPIMKGETPEEFAKRKAEANEELAMVFGFTYVADPNYVSPEEQQAAIESILDAIVEGEDG